MNKKILTIVLCLFSSVENVYSMLPTKDGDFKFSQHDVWGISHALRYKDGYIVWLHAQISQRNEMIETLECEIAKLHQIINQQRSNVARGFQAVEGIFSKNFHLMQPSGAQADGTHPTMVFNRVQPAETLDSDKEAVYKKLIENYEKMIKRLSIRLVQERVKTESKHPIVGLTKSESFDVNDLPPIPERLCLPAELYDTQPKANQMAEISGLYVTESGLFSPISHHALCDIASFILEDPED